VLRPRSHFSRTRINIALGIVAVVLVSEFALFFSLRGLFDRTVISLQENAVEQSIDFSEASLTQLQNRAFNVATAEWVSRLLNQGYRIERDLEAVRNARDVLNDIEGSIPERYVDAVYCYSAYDDSVVTGAGFVDRPIFPREDVIDHVLATGPYLSWEPLPSAGEGSLLGFFVPVPLSYVGGRSHIGVVLDSSVVADSISLGSVGAHFSYLVLDSGGVPLATNLIESALSDVARRVAGAEQGVHRWTIEGQRSFTVVRRTEPLDWTYAITADRGAFLHQSGLFLKYSGVVIVLCIVAGLLISLPLSTIFYRPIRAVANRIHSRMGDIGTPDERVPEPAEPLERIEHEFEELMQHSRRLQERFARDKEVLRDSFVRSVLSGRIDDRDEILAQARYFDVDLDAECYTVLLITYPPESRASIKARQIFKSHADEQLMVLIGRAPESAHTVSEADYVTVLMCHACGTARHEALVQQARELHNRLAEHFGEAFRICVGEPVDSPDAVVLSSKDAVRLFSYGGSAAGLLVLTSDRLNAWPADREAAHRVQQLTAAFGTALGSGNYGGALEAAQRLMEDPVAADSVLLRRMTLTEMAGRLIAHIVYHLEFTDFFAPASNPWAEFQSLSDDDAVRDWFAGVIEKVEAVLQQRERSSKELLVDKIKMRLERDYASVITFQQLSEEFHVSPSYFSSLFKEIERVTCTDYLTKLRVDSACRALQETNKLVKEIAYEHGFGDKQNLIRSFKKQLGMTPSEYRHRQDVARSASRDA
jgi:two-component system, response regulator YesN